MLNEKIKEKVMDTYLYDNYESAEGRQQKVYGFTEDGLKRFTESIIQECAYSLNPMLRDMISRGQGVKLIYNHFGIEQ